MSPGLRFAPSQPVELRASGYKPDHFLCSTRTSLSVPCRSQSFLPLTVFYRWPSSSPLCISLSAHYRHWSCSVTLRASVAVKAFLSVFHNHQSFLDFALSFIAIKAFSLFLSKPYITVRASLTSWLFSAPRILQPAESLEESAKFSWYYFVKRKLSIKGYASPHWADASYSNNSE